VRGVDHPPTSSAEIKERVQLYIYTPLWAFVGCPRANFTFSFKADLKLGYVFDFNRFRIRHKDGLFQNSNETLLFSLQKVKVPSQKQKLPH